jgi:hypothetical protein
MDLPEQLKKEGKMAPQKKVVRVRGNQKTTADRLHRNFLYVFGASFLAELLMRLSPGFLEGIPERDWIEWLLVSLMGVSAYLLFNIAIWYRREDANFLAYRPWYRSTAAKGPIIALVVMIALTNISFQMATPNQQALGVETSEETPDDTALEADVKQDADSIFNFGINFADADDNVLLITAFILGFYSRLANDVLAGIAKFLFKGIYEETYKDEN